MLLQGSQEKGLSPTAGSAEAVGVVPQPGAAHVTAMEGRYRAAWKDGARRAERYTLQQCLQSGQFTYTHAHAHTLMCLCLVCFRLEYSAEQEELAVPQQATEGDVQDVRHICC